jgi:hypothetical protein
LLPGGGCGQVRTRGSRGVGWSQFLVGWSSLSEVKEVGRWAGMVIGGWCWVREWGGNGHRRRSGGRYCQVRERGVVVVVVRGEVV